MLCYKVLNSVCAPGALYLHLHRHIKRCEQNRNKKNHNCFVCVCRWSIRFPRQTGIMIAGLLFGLVIHPLKDGVHSAGLQRFHIWLSKEIRFSPDSFLVHLHFLKWLGITFNLPLKLEAARCPKSHRCGEIFWWLD